MDRLKKEIPEHSQVTFTNGLLPEEWKRTMSTHEIGLVTMKHGAEDILLPSKTYSAMAAGQAILAICPKRSDLADLVRKHKCGWVVEPNDTKALIKVLNESITDSTDLMSKRQNAQSAAASFYDAKPVALQWLELFNQLDTEPCLAL